MSQTPYVEPQIPLWERILGPIVDFLLLTVPAALDRWSWPKFVNDKDQKKMVDAAVDYWAGYFEHPQPRGAATARDAMNAGMDGMQAVFMGLAAIVSTPKVHSPTAIAQFRDNLRALLNEKGATPYGVSLGWDWTMSATDMLPTALKGTGLKVGFAIPARTRMHMDFRQGTVTVGEETICTVPVSAAAVKAWDARERRR